MKAKEIRPTITFNHKLIEKFMLLIIIGVLNSLLNCRFIGSFSKTVIKLSVLAHMMKGQTSIVYTAVKHM